MGNLASVLTIEAALGSGLGEFAQSGAGASLFVVAALLVVLGALLIFRRRARTGSPDAIVTRPNADPASGSASSAVNPGDKVRGEEYGTQTPLRSSAKTGIEVAEADPLAEAAVYLEFGYLDHAAQALRSHVEGAGKGNLEVLRKLLQIYLQLKHIDEYAEILEHMHEAGEDRAYLQEALLAGLGSDIDNLPLRVFAESALGLGPEHLARLLGSDVPIDRDQRPEQETDAISRDAEASPEVATRPGEERAQSPRVVLRLVEGGMRLTSLFTMEEKAMLRVFTHPAHEARLYRTEARLHRDAGNLDAATEALRRAISAHPRALVNFADLLWILHRRGRLNEYAHTLWRLYAVLDGAGRALRERFLGMGLALGRHEILEALVQMTDHRQVEEIGRRFNLLPVDRHSEQVLKLVEAVESEAPEISLEGSAGEVLAEVNAYLEFGQLDQAIEVLEGAILDEPSDPRFYPTLLDLYDRMDDLDRLEVLLGHVKKLVQRPPEEVAPMMMGLQQRLRQRKQGSRYARESR